MGPRSVGSLTACRCCVPDQAQARIRIVQQEQQCDCVKIGSIMAEEAIKKLADLHQPARDGDNDTLLRLIGEGFELDAKDKHSRTPLHLAAWAGHESTVRALVGAGCNVTAAALDDMNALHFCCQKNHKEVARILINAGEARHQQKPTHRRSHAVLLAP